jgi:CubicO group peptidase (beta-lactamase class C family)
MMRYHLVFCLVLFSFSLAMAAGVSQSLTENVEAVVQPYQEYGVFNGSILIAKGKEVIYQRGFGNADNLKNIVNTPYTVFRVGSLSKSFTALLVMQLFEENKLSLTEPLYNILPEYTSQKGRKITVRHLLDHTSGLPGHFALPGWKDGRYQSDFSGKKWLQFISQLDLLAEPGAQYQYGNLNYFLLGSVIEKLTGMSYLENLQKRIFQPAKMHNSGAELSGIHSKIQTQGYQIGKTQDYQVQTALNMQVFFAGANIYSTVVDLFKFEQTLFSGQLLKQKTLEFWLDKEQAFAWQSSQLDVAEKKPLDWLSYNGKLQGFSSMLSVLGTTKIQSDSSQKRFTIIVLSNNGINYRHKLRLTLALSNVLLARSGGNDTQALLLPMTFPLTKAAIEGTLVQQTSYLLSNSKTFEVNEEDINLFAQHLFWAGARHKAILVWELNTQLFTDSDDAYNQLKKACDDKPLGGDSVITCRKYTEMDFDKDVPKGTLIKNITIIPLELSKPLENHDVYIVDDEIVSIGKDLKANANQVLI